MPKILNLQTLRQNLIKRRETLLKRLEVKKTAKYSEDVLKPDRTDLGLALQDSDRDMLLQGHTEGQLHDIDQALRRFEAGTYGRCTACGKEIQPERLEVMPTAAFCISCQRNQEKR